MTINGKSLTWMVGLAAGTAIALLANKTSKTMEKIVKADKAGYTGSIKPARHLYDDSEVNYI